MITEQQSKSRAPHIQALISAALLSTLYISLKSTSIVNAFAYWSIVFLVAAASLSCYISARGIPKYSLCKQDLKVILVSAFSAEVGAPLLIYTGLLYTTPAHGSITSSIEIVLTVLFSAIIVKERLPVRRYLGLALVVAGVAIVTVGGAQFNIGDLMIIGSAALYAFDNSYTVRLSEAIPTERVLQLKFFIGGIALGIIALVLGGPYLSVGSLPLIVFVALFPFAASTVLGTNAIRSIGAVLTIVILSLATPMGVILAVVLLHESANIYVLISSSAAITSGVYYYAKGG